MKKGSPACTGLLFLFHGGKVERCKPGTPHRRLITTVRVELLESEHLQRVSVPEERTSSATSALVHRARAGDREAFDALYASTVGRVYALCLRMSGDAYEGEQLTQDVFVRVWQRLQTFRGDSEFTT